MKKLLFSSLTLILFVSSIAISSCKKDDPTGTPDPCPAATYPVEGLWIGKYNVDQEPAQGDLYYSFIIKPGGTLLTEGLGGDGVTYYGIGTWTMTGGVFTYELQTTNGIIAQEGSLTFSNTGVFTQGTWVDTNNTPDLSGSFPVMNRVN